jgi:hypothetical protein
MAEPLNEHFSDCLKHYQLGFLETDNRRTGKGRIGSISFDEADELFRSWLDESKWPYDALLFDPRIFTFIIEKTSRLLGSRLRGELVPREGSDVVGAKINNAILDLQWDQANHNGSMLSKWALMDINTRKYGAAFALCKWMYEENDKGKPVFDGPEMKVLNNRDCASELAATTMEGCNWFQAREYITGQDLLRVNDVSKGKPVYKNLDRLMDSLSGYKGGADDRSTNWNSRNREISKLSSTPYANDPVYKYAEIVTEYRKDEWITFAPKHNIVLRKIPNPYKNHQIPVVMLRYYPIDDDIYGLSEIEPVKSLQKAINALLCQYVDEINMKLYTPVAIGPGVRQNTLEWGKGSKWLMNNPMTDFRLVESSSNAISYFNNTYSALVAAMMNAIGETSLGVSNIDQYQTTKTATEIKHLLAQRNSRDNFNQMFLAEAIERQMMLWYGMNQQMLFADPSKKTFLIRIGGKDAVRYFQEKGFDKYGLPANAAEYAAENENANPEEMKVPLYPVESGTEDESRVVSKLTVEDNMGRLYVEPEDLSGMYDYIADVRSMALNAGQDEKMSRDKAMTTLLTNPNASALLQQENVKPKFKELFISWLEDSGFKDAGRYFEGSANNSEAAPPGAPQPPGGPQLPELPNLQGTPGRKPGSVGQNVEEKFNQAQAQKGGAPGMEEMPKINIPPVTAGISGSGAGPMV